MIISPAVTRSNCKKIYANIAKNRFQYLAMPTSITTNAVVLKFLPTLSLDYNDNLLKDF